ncbi:GTA-gp10 family protein [Phenylobacterium sp.]|uniref:GTA-gp10 family protein n=1 Tax=Phenylobacterium sp. TaxID=1871053 RepID=UPI003919AE1E
MSNPLKGEVAFRAGDATYRLVYAIDALIALEDRYGKSVAEVGQMIADGMGPRDMLAIWHAGLLECHPDLDEAAAKRLVAQVGIGQALQLIGRAFAAAFLVEPEDGAKRPGPRKAAAAGTGAAS